MKKILMNINPWQTRIAVIKDGELQNIYFSAHAKERIERSFFKGVVNKVLPGIQTAFVDIGQARAGFLHISEVDRELALQRMSAGVELDDQVGVEQASGKSLKTLDISKIFNEGESVLVQVIKEPIYEKGAKLSTCFTLPGRFVVLMPNIDRLAISKKIEDPEERGRLKEILRNNLPQGMGAIIRTTSEGRKEGEIIRDLNYLISTWNEIVKKFATGQPKEKLYEDLPLVLRVVRDQLGDDIESVIIDDPAVQKQVYKFVKTIAPELSYKIKLYKGHKNLFERYDIEKQIDEALSKKVELKSGGSIIIESTEAMTVIDVNTGRYTGKKNLEETILRTNLEAAHEIVWQLKLRNIGGLIVIDFIDMSLYENKQKLFKYFEKTLKEEDKLQSVILRISEFGLVQMTRKRSGKTLQQELTGSCPECHGLGFILTVQTESYRVLNKIKEKLSSGKLKGNVKIALHPKVFEYITSVEYNSIIALEKMFNCRLTLVTEDDIAISNFKVT